MKIVRVLTVAFRPLRMAFSWVVSCLIPRNRKAMVFGGWSGTSCSDNPKYFLGHLLAHSDYKITWIGATSVRDALPHHPNLAFAERGSWRAAWAILRAKTAVFCQVKEADFGDCQIFGRMLRLNLWHGIPIKRMGQQAPAVEKGTVLQRLYTRLIRYGHDYTSVSNDKAGDLLAKGFPTVFSAGRMLKMGSPRNDYLIGHAQDGELIGELKRKYAALLGFDASKRVVLYLPTFREVRTGKPFSFYSLSREEQLAFKAKLDAKNAVLVEKHHPHSYACCPVPAKGSFVSCPIPASLQGRVDTQELLLIADMLICDYSSAYIDFALLGRPIVHYAPDLREYERDTGLAYDFKAVAGGRIFERLDDAEAEVLRQLDKAEIYRGPEFDSLVAYEKGTACEQLLKFIEGKLGR